MQMTILAEAAVEAEAVHDGFLILKELHHRNIRRPFQLAAFLSAAATNYGRAHLYIIRCIYLYIYMTLYHFFYCMIPSAIY